MQNPIERPSVTVEAHAHLTASHAVMAPDQPLSAHSMISQAMDLPSTIAMAQPPQDSVAIPVPAPNLTQVRCSHAQHLRSAS